MGRGGGDAAGEASRTALAVCWRGAGLMRGCGVLRRVVASCSAGRRSHAVGCRAAPCYAQVEEALKSLDAAMLSGFDNYDQIRRDKNLSNVRPASAPT